RLVTPRDDLEFEGAPAEPISARLQLVGLERPPAQSVFCDPLLQFGERHQRHGHDQVRVYDVFQQQHRRAFPVIVRRCERSQRTQRILQHQHVRLQVRLAATDRPAEWLVEELLRHLVVDCRLAVAHYGGNGARDQALTDQTPRWLPRYQGIFLGVVVVVHAPQQVEAVHEVEQILADVEGDCRGRGRLMRRLGRNGRSGRWLGQRTHQSVATQDHQPAMPGRYELDLNPPIARALGPRARAWHDGAGCAEASASKHDVTGDACVVDRGDERALYLLSPLTADTALECGPLRGGTVGVAGEAHLAHTPRARSKAGDDSTGERCDLGAFGRR